MKFLYILFLAVFFVVFTAVLGPKIYKDFVYSHNEPKVFYVSVTSPTRSTHGSGFHVKNSKGKMFLLTNKHVCGEDLNTKVTIYKNNTEFDTEIIKLSKKKDLCALKPFPNAKSYSFNHRLYINEPVSVVGYPSNYPLYVSKGDIIGSISYEYPIDTSSKADCESQGGYWSSVLILTLKIHHCIFSNKMLVSTNSVRPGNSGSPLVDFFGNVVATDTTGGACCTSSVIRPAAHFGTTRGA
jgi:S1-C subfamily serine protease